ncbi:hypothetical protein OLP53_02380 [Campylobacter jejuni]|nr:hypothetical protein [Campylobacter jejuni]
MNFDNYKIFIPRIFRKYNQVIYLSYNLLIKHNILELLSYKNKAINCSLDVYNSIIAFMPNSKIGKKINQDLKIINSELIVYNILECERNDFFNFIIREII